MISKKTIQIDTDKILDFSAFAGLVTEYRGKVSAALHVGVVAEHQHRVGGHLEVDFNDVRSHLYDAFDGGDGVFGEVAPVAAVADHNDIFRLGIVNLRRNRRRPVGILAAISAGSALGR